MTTSRSTAPADIETRSQSLAASVLAVAAASLVAACGDWYETPPVLGRRRADGRHHDDRLRRHRPQRRRRARRGRLDHPGRRRSGGLRAQARRREEARRRRPHRLERRRSRRLPRQADQAAGEGDATRLVLGDGIPTIDVDGEPNPHFWLDPTLVAGHYVPAIAAALSRARPGRSRRPTRRMPPPTRRSSRRSTRRTWPRSRTIPAAEPQARDLPRRLPVLRRALRLRAHRGHPRRTSARSRRAADLAALVDKVKAAGVKAVFSEAQFSPELAQTLADEAGITNVVTTLYNDTVGPAPGRHLPRDDERGTSTRSCRRSR